MALLQIPNLQQIPFKTFTQISPKSRLAILSAPPKALPETREPEEQACVCADRGQHGRCSKSISELT